MQAVLHDVQALLPGERLRLVDTVSDGERSAVVRVRAETAAGSRMLIVKRYRQPGERWIRECAALSTVPPGVRVPTLVAESAQPPIAVLADLGDGANVAGALLGTDPSLATDALTRWARALAHLHSATRDSRERFGAELTARAGGATVHLTSMRVLLEDSVRVLDRLCGVLSVVVPASAWEQLRGLADRLGADGPNALTPADTCPDNCVLVGEDLVLVDFEDAQFRHIAWDVAYLSVPWPTCWCSWALPPDATAAALTAYRGAAVHAFPEVGEEQFARDIDAAALGWAFISASASLDLALGEDPEQAPPARPDKPTPSPRARILHRLEAAATVTHEPVLATLAAALAVQLRARWGEAVRLDRAPAYRR